MSRRCPLCDTKLVEHTCPVCSSLAALNPEPGTGERTLRDPRAARPKAARGAKQASKAADEKAEWYAAAGMKRPEPLIPERKVEPDEPLPELSKREEEDRGFTSAAVVLVAIGISQLAIIPFGGFPGIQMLFLIAASFVFAAMLWRSNSLARWFVLLFCGYLLFNRGMAFALYGSAWNLVAMVAPLAVVANIFLIHSARVRLISSIVGALFAFAWLIPAFQTPKKAEDVLAKLAIREGRFEDPKLKLAVQAPEGILLFDGKKLAAELTKRSRRSLVSKLISDPPEQRFARDTLAFMNADATVEGGITASSFPPHLTIDTILPSLGLVGKQSVRQDNLVPDGIKYLEGATTQGWRTASRGGSRDVIVVRMADGRMYIAHCLYSIPGIDRLCREVFHSLSITP